MSEKPNQSSGPSPLRPAGSLRFQNTKGFTLHKRKADETDPMSTCRHMKVHMDPHGALRLTTHLFAAPSNVPKSTNIDRDADCYEHVEIPECRDNLPPEVDLGILDTERRPAAESVSLNPCYCIFRSYTYI